MQAAIVDDSEVIRDRLCKRLSRLTGVQIAWQAEDAQKAIAAIRQQPPDAVILDLHMPGSSGFEVLKKATKECPHITVIILTNYALPLLKKRCIKAGADYFFDKSTEFEKVVAVLKLMLNDRGVTTNKGGTR
ncbi:MAG: response regulator transcription factor [bacterium]